MHDGREVNVFRKSPGAVALVFVLLTGALQCDAVPEPVAPTVAPAERSPAPDASPVPAVAPDESGCDNSEGTRGDCFSIVSPEGGARCNVTAYWTQGICQLLGEVFVPRVAEAFADCLRGNSGTVAACQSEATLDCALSAMKKSCVQDETDAACREYLKRCPPTPQTERFHDQELCRSALSSLPVTARADVLECIAGDCDLRLCVSQVY